MKINYSTNRQTNGDKYSTLLKVAEKQCLL